MANAHAHAGHDHDHGGGTNIAVKGFFLLLAVTVLEVLIALVGNGHISEGLHFPKIPMVIIMCGLSLYKAYYIVKEFMHLGHETRGMAASVVLPTLLLVWGIIAFLWEGGAWRGNRNRIDTKNKESVGVKKPTGHVLQKASDMPTAPTLN